MSNKPIPQPSARGYASAYTQLEDWLRRRRKHLLTAIVAIAFLLRVFCFLELANSPCFWWHEWTESDLHTFHSWALAIGDGDWWSTTVRPPLHGWHREIAEDYARIFPERWAALKAANPSSDPDSAARALWNHWCGGGRTYQGPLYPYLIAGTYLLLGPAVGWVYAGQILLGIVSVMLVHVLARRYFGEVAAIMAAALALLYGPLLFYEFVLLRVTLIVFWGLLLVFLLDEARERPTVPAWAAVGVTLGLSVALKAHFVLVVFAAVALLVVGYRKQWRRCGRCAMALALGGFISFSPVVARNLVAGAPPLDVASNGPPTFLISNAEDSGYVRWGTRHTARILAETDNAFLPTAVATLKTHPSFASYLRLLAEKVFATCYWFEEPNNANFYYAQLHSNVLRSLPVSFGAIGPPAIVGLVLALRRCRRCAPLYFVVLTNCAVLHFFFVFGRFRLPLVAALLPFAGFAVARLIQAVLARRWKTAGAIVGVCVVLGVFTLGPSTGDQPLVRSADVQVGHQVYYDVLLQSALSQGDLDAAADVLRESLRRQPPEVRALGPSRPARSVQEAQLAALYAAICRRHARVLQHAGRAAEAEKQLKRSTELLQASKGVLHAGTSTRSWPHVEFFPRAASASASS
ncbi:MAG: glycosyltransferase family 39 protein [Phycisphaerae bacterium]